MSLPRAVGGYFELELRRGREYHQDAIRLNTGRNALEYILKTRRHRKVYIPYYTCEVLLQPILKLGIDFEYYKIDKSFEPLFDFQKIGVDEAFVYTNYFGLKDQYISSISGQVRNLIIDNAQAFFSRPVSGVDTFYSARKFFGVPDGAYLFTDQKSDESFDQDHSSERCAHLLARADSDAETGYPSFLKNEELLDNNPIRKMSRLTQALLGSIDYEEQKKRRQENFYSLHLALKDFNLLPLSLDSEIVPLAYPFLTEDNQLRRRLIDGRVYIARYWQEVRELVNPDSLEYKFTENLLPLPIDHRLGQDDLQHIINLVQHEHQG
jgi:hypothetical protein